MGHHLAFSLDWNTQSRRHCWMGPKLERLPSLVFHFPKKGSTQHCQRHNEPMPLSRKLKLPYWLHIWPPGYALHYLYRFQVWPPYGSTCITYKFGYKLASVALVLDLAARWCHLHCLPGIVLLALSVSIQLVSSSVRVPSVNSTKHHLLPHCLTQ